VTAIASQSSPIEQHQFQLWHLFAWLSVNAVLLGIFVVLPWEGRDWAAIVVNRLLLLAAVPPILGFLTGRQWQVVLACAVTMAAADVTWLAFDILIDKHFSVNSLRFNPLLVILLFVLPTAAIRNHIIALVVGIGLSVVIPISFAVAGLTLTPVKNEPCNGLVHVFIVVIALMLLVAGVAATVATRLLLVLDGYLRTRLRSG
jgi:hypothetical protein